MISMCLDNKSDWLDLAYGLVYPISVVKWGRKKNRETDGEHDGGCVEEEFQFTIGKFDRDDEGGREAVGMGFQDLKWIRTEISFIRGKRFIF